MGLKTANRVFVTIAFVLALKYALLIAWALEASRYALEDVLSGYDVHTLVCNQGEFIDHIAVSMGLSFADAKQAQRSFYVEKGCAR